MVKTTRMTTAQAIVKFLDNQYVSMDGKETKFVEGFFTIFGHGIAVGLGEALDTNPGGLRVMQGRNEQGMCHTAIAFAKQSNRRRIIPCASSVGPGAANMVTACATGTHCIGEAFRSIQYGEADVMVAGGTEASITPIGVAGFTALTALSTSEDPMRASIPFDKERDGFVMGEGSGIVVLEELEHAKARGAHIYAELIGYGATCDAYHITSPAEDGSGAAKAMEMAIADGGIAPEEVDYVNAHGTSTHHNDLFETKAIKLALGDHAYHVHINSTKSMIGHLLGAAGGVEFIACVKSIEEGFVHATAGLEIDDEECDLDYTKGEGVAADIRCAISNSLGFGGHNASLLVKRYED